MYKPRLCAGVGRCERVDAWDMHAPEHCNFRPSRVWRSPADLIWSQPPCPACRSKRSCCGGCSARGRGRRGGACRGLLACRRAGLPDAKPYRGYGGPRQHRHHRAQHLYVVGHVRAAHRARPPLYEPRACACFHCLSYYFGYRLLCVVFCGSPGLVGRKVGPHHGLRTVVLPAWQSCPTKARFSTHAGALSTGKCSQ